MERVRSEDGALHFANTVQFTDSSILRSRKRRNSGGSEGSVKSFPPGYDLYILYIFPFLTSTAARIQNPSGRQDGGRQADA